MKTLASSLIISFLLVVSRVATGDKRQPIAFSPGNETVLAPALQRYPTFSRSVVEQETDRAGMEYGTEGTSNTFYGVSAGASITSGTDNTFIGVSAGRNNTSGGDNTFIGHWAGYDNTFLGRVAGYANTTVKWNTCLGYSAGYNNTNCRHERPKIPLPMDIVAVLTKVTQDQQELNRKQQQIIEKMKMEIAELKKNLPKQK